MSTFDVQVCFCQEISVPFSELGAQHSTVRNTGYKSYLTGPDPELSNVTGGVGVIYKDFKALKLNPQIERLAQASSNGRFQLIGLVLPGDVVLTVANLY
eukprot:10228702-Karenia_brevis.AAC.1